MANGLYNPGDDTRATTVRPTEVSSGAGVDKYYDPAQRTRIKAQDLNRILVALRQVAVGSEGDDAALLNGIKALIRERLAADRTYYVRTDGNDANNGLANTAGGAFLTINKAIAAAQLLDLNEHTVTIQVADGTYTDAIVINHPFIRGKVILQGNVTTPANCIINTTGTCLSMSLYADIEMLGFKLVSTQYLIFLNLYARVSLTGLMEFGAAGANQAQINVQIGSEISIGANYTISGGAASHMAALYGSTISFGTGLTVTMTGTPAFASGYYVAKYSGVIDTQDLIYSGSATGYRYDVSAGATLRSSSTAYYDYDSVTPGDAKGFIRESFFSTKEMVNRLINPMGQVADQAAGSVTDGSYGQLDHWYALYSNNQVTPSQLANPTDEFPTACRVTQINASAQRFGLAQIIESARCTDLRGKRVRLQVTARRSTAATIRFAIMEWTGTADAPVKDVVNTWASSTFTAGNFFINNANLIITSTGSVTSGNNTFTTFLSNLSTALLGTAFNNLIVFIWAGTTGAQNDYLDFVAQLYEGTDEIKHARRAIAEERLLCARFKQAKPVQTENGSRHIPLLPMRATPIVTASVGTPANATPFGFELSHTSAAASNIVADAEIGV